MTATPPMQRRLDFLGGNAEAFNSREPEVLLAAAAGTGKSIALLTKCLTLLDKYPGCRGLLLRGTRASLTQSALVTWEDGVLGSDHRVLVRNPIKRRVRQSYEFENRSEFVVAGLDDPGKTLSAQYDFVYIQEATEEGVTLDHYETLLRLMRNGKMVKDGLPYHQIMMDCNPTSPAHWLYQRQLKKKLRMYTSLHKDNPAYWDRAKNDWTPAGFQYVEGTLRRMTGARLARFYHGRWEAAEGLVFDGFVPRPHDAADNPGHLLPKGWQPPESWPRVWAIDWGFTSPLVVQLWAVDGDGRMYLYRELYRTQLRAEEAGEWAKGEIDAGREPPPRGVVCDHDPLMKAEFEKGSGLALELADKKDLLAGIQEVQGRFDRQGDGRPRIYVADECVDRIDQRLEDAGQPTCFQQELSAYIWDQNSIKDMPVDKFNHSCFAAGTEVETDAGPVPIELVLPGDRVLTRAGYRRVLDCGMTNPAARVVRLGFSDGRELTLTPNHPVWVPEVGHLSVDELRYNMPVLTLTENDRWTSSVCRRQSGRRGPFGFGSVGSCTAAIPTQSSRPIGTTTEPGGATVTADWATCTGTCGSTTTGRYRSGMRLTTETATRPTTPCSTCNCSYLPSTRRSIGKRPSPGRGRECWPCPWTSGGSTSPRPPLGTARPRGWSGTVATPRKSPPTRHWWITSASGAARLFRSSGMPPDGPGSAATPARLPTGEPVALTMLTGRAPDATPCSESTSTPSSEPAPCGAAGGRRLSGPASGAERPSPALPARNNGTAGVRVCTRRVLLEPVPVFNLTVEGEPEYYANGVLVHNCDCSRYASRWVTANLSASASAGPVGVEWAAMGGSAGLPGSARSRPYW